MQKKTIDDLINEHGLNIQQAKVVESNDKEVIVPAGAGSGKTKTLVTKVMELLSSGNSLDNFLVLTFTKKAASEMKDRIKRPLVDANMVDMANKVDSSNISTFDAFAYNFVKQNASSIGLDSSIELLDPVIFYNFKVEIMSKILFEIMIHKNQEDNIYNFLTNFSGKFNENDLVSSLLSTYNNLSEIGSMKELDFTKLRIVNNFFDYDTFYNNLENISDEFTGEYFEFLSDVKKYFSYLNGNSDDFTKVSYPSRIGWKKLGISDDTKKLILSELSVVKNLIAESPKREDLVNLLKIEEEKLKIIQSILIDFEEEITAFKQRTNKYEFSDIANFLNKILKENDNILQRQKDKFIYVFVDEYQDTSKVQADFLEMLITDNDLIKVLYVGDIKQSIYKFRNARPDTFLKKQDTAINIPLEINYRSSKNVITFVNKIFTDILHDKDTHDIDYKNGHLMGCGNTSFNSDESADVFLLEMYKEEDSRLTSDPVEEAFLIGNTIKKLLSESKITKYSDVAILARNKASFKIYQDVFSYLDIPLQIQVDKSLKETYGFKLISNILKLASTLFDEGYDAYNKRRFYYYSLVRSELYNYSDYEVFNELLNKDDITEKTFNINDEIKEKLINLNKVISSQSNFEIIDYLIKEFNFYENISTTKKSKEKNYQIEFLYKLASTLSDLSITSFYFVNYIENIAYDEEINLSIGILDDKEENSVRITNIHQSKGLEYNTLFVTGLNKKFNKSQVKQFNYTNSALFNIDLKNSTYKLPELALNDYIKKYRSSLTYQDNLKEELRLLYVALTRAEKALYIVTIPKDNYDKLESFTDYLYYHDFNKYIKKENITSFTNHFKTHDYYLSLSSKDKYYPKEIDGLVDVSFDIKKVENKLTKASTSITSLITKSEYQNISEGNKLHLDFEFKNLENNLVNKLYNTTFNNKNIKDSRILTEHEFNYYNGTEYINGIIDLLCIYEDEIHIIDYKLRDLSNENYINQLKTYKTYIESIYPLNIKTYLYSITTGAIKEVI